MAELNWNEVKTGGGEVKFLKLQAGRNTVRLVSNPYLVDNHWETTTDGKKVKVVCPGVGCPICKENHTPTSRYQIYVIDRVDGQLKLLEGGNAIFSAIKTFAMDPDYGNPMFYDLKIMKEGSGRDTKYTVIASPNKSKITEEEQALVEAAKPLAELNKPKTADEIKQMNLQLFDDMGGGNDDWESFDQTPANNQNNGNPSSVSDDDWGSL